VHALRIVAREGALAAVQAEGDPRNHRAMSTPRIVRLAARGWASMLVDERQSLAAILDEAAESFRLSAERLAAAGRKTSRATSINCQGPEDRGLGRPRLSGSARRAAQLSHAAAEDPVTELLARDPQIGVEPDRP